MSTLSYYFRDLGGSFWLRFVEDPKPPTVIQEQVGKIFGIDKTVMPALQFEFMAALHDANGGKIYDREQVLDRFEARMRSMQAMARYQGIERQYLQSGFGD